MPRYVIRLREVRIHTKTIEANNMLEAEEFAGELEAGDCDSDAFDECEVLDVMEE